MAKKTNPKDNEKPFTRSDVHALSIMTELTEREQEILFGDTPVTYDEYSALFDKLMEDLDDYESAMALRVKCKDVIEKHAKRVMADFDPNAEPYDPVLTTHEEMSATRQKIAEDFPEIHADTEEMLALGKKRNDEMRAEKASMGSKAAELVEQFREKIADEQTAAAAGFISVEEWNNCCDRIKYAALGGNTAAIDGVFAVQRKGGLWDVTILGGSMRALYTEL